MRALVLMLSVCCQFTFAADLPARLEKILKSSSIPRENLGLLVVDLSKDGKVLANNEVAQLIPASVSKLATASTVLQRLGPSYKFQTTLWSAGKTDGGVLNGDLILKGGGDPGFVSETMWFLVNDFVRSGITKINGDVIVDDTDFDSIRADPSREPERVDRAYDAPVGAMSFNWNSISIFVRPTKVGDPAQVVIDPLNDYYQIENKTKTVTKGGSSLEFTRAGSKVIVHGTIGIEHDEVVAYKNVDDPIDWSGRNLVFFLAQRGISVSGKVKAGKKPDKAKQLAKADSKPVAQSVADMMKFSNNYVAEMLTKDLAAQNGTKPASLEDGMKLVRAHLSENIGINDKRVVLENPSGLSRHNRLSARNLVDILLHAQRSFPTFAEFLSGLPLAGLDGTLKKRMTASATQGWVRAKTGSLAGVVTLAGFAGRKDGDVKAFAFIYNGKSAQDDSARHLFDQLASELVQ